MQHPRIWVVMYVDIVSSTELKYKEAPEAVASLIEDFFKSVQDETMGRAHIKFTGDGAMVIFPQHDDGCRKALESAERILQTVDRANLTFKNPRIHIRIGISTGECYEVSTFGPELSGKTADLAARLCGESDIDSVLIDETTKKYSGQPPYKFELCSRRLSLRGVPMSAAERDNYYYFKPSRFLKPPKQDHYSKGLLALYPDRFSLARDLTAVRIMGLAMPRSTVLIAGRTLINWTELGEEMKLVANERDIKFHLVISSENVICSDPINRYLDKQQLKEMKTDLPRAREYFLDLMEQDKDHFQLHETDQIILDGITCAEVRLPGEKEDKGKLIVLQDINAAPGDDKASFLLGCKCNGEKNNSCMAHGLYDRTERIFDKSELPKNGRVLKPLQRILRQHLERTGLGNNLPTIRNNPPTKYVSRIKQYFPLIKEGKLNSIPAPLCVQMQVSSICSTHCRMCDHWQNPNPNELSIEEWTSVFKDLVEFGVKSAIFSGGEPLMREGIVELLRSARMQGLRLGMLTNGTMRRDDPEVVAAIKETVEWVAISIDGTSSEDEKIRNPIKGEAERINRLKVFCAGLQNGPKLSATVTLQPANIDMNFKEACDFVREEIGIPQVNFKLATGAQKALTGEKSFLLSDKQLGDLEEFLWNNPLPQEKGNNLDYLRRTFANGIFNRKDTTDGAPVRSFYARSQPRCHTPFLFSLIDSDGEVYPCCHLYRDNHGSDPRSSEFRQKHRLGNVKNKKFAAIWNGEQYETERKRLQTIDPHNGDFLPCGECTRHCQHNLVLTKIYREYETNSRVLDELVDENPQQDPVWF